MAEISVATLASQPYKALTLLAFMVMLPGANVCCEWFTRAFFESL